MSNHNENEPSVVCPVTLGRCPLEDQTWREMPLRVQQIHAALFGIEQQGGVVRQVEKVETLMDEQRLWKAKTMGWTAAMSGVVTFIATKLWGHLLK